MYASANSLPCSRLPAFASATLLGPVSKGIRIICASANSHPCSCRPGRTASAGASAPEPPRATGVGPESPFFCLFLSCFAAVEAFLVNFSIFPEFGRLLNPNFESGNSCSLISERGDVRSQKREKRRVKRGPRNRPEKDTIREPLVRLLWRAAAPGLAPLRLPHARESGSWPGQPALPTTGLTTRAFRRPLLLPNPRAIECSDNVLFLFHPPHLSCHLSAPLPDNSIIIVIVVSEWIVLSM